MNNATFDDAIELATRAHAGQTDKAGKNYIEHPLRVSENCVSHDAKIAAVLHDVVEDSDVTIEDLRAMNFAPQVVEAIELLTKTDNIEYSKYIEKIKANAIAREVKIADLRDNMDLSRLKNPSEKDLKRVEKYRGALVFLKG